MTGGHIFFMETDQVHITHGKKRCWLVLKIQITGFALSVLFLFVTTLPLLSWSHFGTLVVEFLKLPLGPFGLLLMSPPPSGRDLLIVLGIGFLLLGLIAVSFRLPRRVLIAAHSLLAAIWYIFAIGAAVVGV